MNWLSHYIRRIAATQLPQHLLAICILACLQLCPSHCVFSSFPLPHPAQTLCLGFQSDFFSTFSRFYNFPSYPFLWLLLLLLHLPPENLLFSYSRRFYYTFSLEAPYAWNGFFVHDVSNATCLSLSQFHVYTHLFCDAFDNLALIW